MSSERDKNPLDAERLVELAVDSTAQLTAAERQALQGDSKPQREWDELRGFVDRQRALCEKLDARDRSALVERIFGATTERDLGWSGDLRLVRDWVLESCRRSVWVRVAAASLLLHLAALPVLAWYVYRERTPEPQIYFERPQPPEIAEEPVALPEVEAPDALRLLQDEPSGTPDVYSVANARRRARFVLHRRGAPELEGVATAGILGQLLAGRSRGINAGDWSELPELESLAGDPLAIALLAEARIDRAILEPGGAGLREVLEALNPNSGALAAGTVALVRAAAGRALELDLADEDLRAGWHCERWYEGNPQRAGRPMSRAWFTQLEHELAGITNEPALDVWLSWDPR